MLKSMGERTPPCGTPDLNCRFVDVWFLNVVYAMRPLKHSLTPETQYNRTDGHIPTTGRQTGTSSHKTQKTPSPHYNHRQTYMTQTRHSPTYSTKQERNTFQ